MKVKAGRWLSFTKEQRLAILFLVARKRKRKLTKEEYYEYHERYPIQ